MRHCLFFDFLTVLCYNYKVAKFKPFCVIPVKLGWDPTARTERDGASRGQKIFHQKNTCGEDGNPCMDPRIRKDDNKCRQLNCSLKISTEKRSSQH